MELYWVSAIVQSKVNSKPWLLSDCSGKLSLENALKEIEDMKTKFTVLCAWIDTYDALNIKQTVFHECYIDAFGNLV